MSRASTLAIGAFSLCIASVASAQAPATPATQPGLSVKKVCKSEPVVGTRFAKKICRTPEEWAALQQNDRRTLEDYQRAPCRSGAAGQSGGVQC